MLVLSEHPEWQNQSNYNQNQKGWWNNASFSWYGYFSLILFSRYFPWNQNGWIWMYSSLCFSFFDEKKQLEILMKHEHAEEQHVTYINKVEKFFNEWIFIRYPDVISSTHSRKGSTSKEILPDLKQLKVIVINYRIDVIFTSPLVTVICIENQYRTCAMISTFSKISMSQKFSKISMWA